MFQEVTSKVNSFKADERKFLYNEVNAGDHRIKHQILKKEEQAYLNRRKLN
jgi:hypothetical protein